MRNISGALLLHPGIHSLKSAVTVALIVALFPGFNARAELITFQNNWGNAGFNIVQQDESGIEIVFSVSSMEVMTLNVCGEIMQGIGIPGVMLPNNAGAPNLPGTGRFIALPQGATAELEIVECRTEVFPDMNIAPAFQIPLGNDNSPLVYEKDPSIYNVNAYYPAEPVTVSDPAQIRGVDAVVLGITPFQYNPVTQDLMVYKDIRVRLNFVGGNGHFGEDRLRSRWWEPILRQNLLNYATLPSANFNNVPSGTDLVGAEYIIIVPDDSDFVAWADTLKQWRSEQGIITTVTTLTEIGGNASALIEDYIATAYNTWDIPPVAVLLLADYQEPGNPAGISAPFYDDFVSDNFYADVNADGLPDLNIARITAQDSDDLEEVITKMLDYEREPYTDPDFYRYPVTAGGWQTDSWFILCDEVIGGYLHNILGKDPVREYAIYSGTPGSIWSSNINTWMVVNYFGPEGLGYIPATPSYLTNWNGNATRLNTDISNGCFIIQHRDHGSVNGWSEPDYHISDLRYLENEKYPYVFSVNCLTGKFNNSSPSFAEVFHRMEYGALGILAATGVSYSFVNDVFIWGVFDFMWPDFDPGYGITPPGEINILPGFANASGKYYLAASSWPWNPQHKERTYHLFHHHGDAFLTLYSEVPQFLTVTHDSTIPPGATSFSVRADEASLIGLSVDGEVIGSAEGTGSPVLIPIVPVVAGKTMRVTVTKTNYYRYIADVPVVSSCGPYVIFNSCQIDDSSGGNNNAQWDFNERVDLSIEVKNIGVETATAVNVGIVSADSLITIVVNQENYGDIRAGDSLMIPDGFRVEIEPQIGDQYAVPFTLTATSDPYSWQSYFSLTVSAPLISLNEIAVQDSEGNNNEVLDPGETASLLLTVSNNGHSATANLLGTLTADDPQINVLNNPVNFGDLQPGDSLMRAFSVSAGSSYSSGTETSFTFAVADDNGYSCAESFSLLIGDVRDQPSGPDNYGYYAWDDNDRGESHPFDWVEIAPAAGGPGTPLAIYEDDQTVQVALPFTFSYYGQDFTQISVCSNGWLALGNTSSNVWTNSSIPNSYGPPAMIASFWDNLDPGYAGAQICAYFDDSQHYFIVEWYEVAHYAQANNRVTFEVILYDPAFYPTTSGDGIIVMQYQQVSNASSATVGIEDRSETDGLQYVYNADYDENAWPIEQGRTITFSTTTSDSKADNPALPSLPTTICRESRIPHSFSLLQNHPNPFNPLTSIRFALPEAAQVSLNVYDISGRLVATLLNAWCEAGFHTVKFDASGLTSGLYIYRLKSKSYVANGKMLLLK